MQTDDDSVNSKVEIVQVCTHGAYTQSCSVPTKEHQTPSDWSHLIHDHDVHRYKYTPVLKFLLWKFVRRTIPYLRWVRLIWHTIVRVTMRIQAIGADCFMNQDTGQSYITCQGVIMHHITLWPDVHTHASGSGDICILWYAGIANGNQHASYKSGGIWPSDRLADLQCTMVLNCHACQAG